MSNEWKLFFGHENKTEINPIKKIGEKSSLKGQNENKRTSEIHKIIGFCISEKEFNPDYKFKKYFPWLKFEKISVAGWHIHLWGHGDFRKFISDSGEFRIIAGYTDKEMEILGTDELKNRGIIIKIVKEKLQFENDTTGSFQVFYGQSDKNVCISSDENLILQCLGRKDHDKTNLLQYLLTGHLTGDTTLYPHIKTMEANSKLSYERMNFKTAFREPLRFRHSGDPVEVMHNITVDTIQKYSDPYEKMFLPLSGGYDSRMFAACVNDPERFFSKTYGYSHPLENSYEIAFAKEVVKRAGFSEWEIFDLGNDYIADYLQMWYDIFGTSHHHHGMYQLKFYEYISKEQGATFPTLSGFVGDVFAGNQLGQLLIFPNANKIEKFWLSQKSEEMSFSVNELKQIMKFQIEPFLKDIGMRWQSYWQKNEGEEYQKFILTFIRHRGRNHISYLCKIGDLYGACVTPYIDKDYISTILGLPFNELLKRNAQEKVFKKYFPQFWFDKSRFSNISYEHRDRLGNVHKRGRDNLYPVVKNNCIVEHELFNEGKIFDMVKVLDSLHSLSDAEIKNFQINIGSLRPLNQINLLQPMYFRKLEDEPEQIEETPEPEDDFDYINILKEAAEPVPKEKPEQNGLKFLQIHTFYDQVLKNLYQKHQGLENRSFSSQIDAAIDDGFGAVHMFAPYMEKAGYKSQLIIANNVQSQLKWLQENNISQNEIKRWMFDIPVMQVDEIKPDILFIGETIAFDQKFLSLLNHKPKLIIGWRASDIPQTTDWNGFDIIFSPLTGVREKAIEIGAKNAGDFAAGYPEWIYDEVKNIDPEYDLVFAGQWTLNQHKRRGKYLDLIARKSGEDPNFSCGFYLSGQLDSLTQPVRKYQKGPKFGIDMNRSLRTGRIVFDARAEIGMRSRDISEFSDLARRETGNMRIIEATGGGSFLLTEHFDNLSKMFEIGKEIETFRDKEELIDKIRFYSEHQNERMEIAERGHERCMKAHSMTARTAEFDEIIRKYLKKEEKEQASAKIETKAKKGKIVSPLTGSSNVELEEKIPVSQILNEYRINFGMDGSRYFGDLKEISVYRCADTGYRFYHPYSITGDSDFYRHLSGIDWYYMDWKWENQVTLDLLTDDEKVLEIGSGKGSFLEKLSGNNIVCTGLELNTEQVSIAKEKGLDVRRENIVEHAEKNKEHYDVVCSFQVAEHIAEIGEFIRDSLKALKPGGKMIISVPNHNSFFGLDKQNALDKPPHHMGLWDEFSLSKIPDFFDLDIKSIHYEPLQDYHYDYYRQIMQTNIKNEYGLFGYLDKIIRENPDNIRGATILAEYRKRG